MMPCPAAWQLMCASDMLLPQHGMQGRADMQRQAEGQGLNPAKLPAPAAA